MDMTPLRRTRLCSGHSLKRVAREAGIDSGNLSRIERRRARATPEVAERLARYFGGRISELEILYPERYIGGAADQLNGSVPTKSGSSPNKAAANR